MKGPKAKRALSQNFLVDAGAARRIAWAAEVGVGDLVLEVGAGKGELTGPLLETGAEVIAVEIDGRMIEELKRRFADAQNITIVHADILSLNLEEILGGRKAVIVANLPYNLSSPFLFLLFAQRKLFHKAVLTLQLEFARRLTGKVGTKDWGILTVFCSLAAKPRILFKLSPNLFRPIPKVFSAVVSLDFDYEPPATPADLIAFKKIVRTAFGKRRKMIGNSLENLLAPNTKPLLEASGIDPKRRPETLELAEWVRLADASGPILSERL